MRRLVALQEYLSECPSLSLLSFHCERQDTWNLVGETCHVNTVVSGIQTSELLKYSLLLLQPHNCDLFGRIGQLTKTQRKARLPGSNYPNSAHRLLSLLWLSETAAAVWAICSLFMFDGAAFSLSI